MGKRSSFARHERDFYPTPWQAVVPLLPHLPPEATFAEPCAGDGALVRFLEAEGFRCAWASDVAPAPASGIREADALSLTGDELDGASIIVTNPPWARPVLHPLIERLSSLRLTWLLFDADWAHTRQAGRLLRRCRKIVSVGRVKWIEGSPHTGKDNAAWYLFGEEADAPAEFVGRVPALA